MPVTSQAAPAPPTAPVPPGGLFGGISIKLIGSPFDRQSLAVGQRVGDLVVRRVEDPPERLPRHTHPRCRLGLVETFVVGKPYRFELVDCERHLRQS